MGQETIKVFLFPKNYDLLEAESLYKKENSINVGAQVMLNGMLKKGFFYIVFSSLLLSLGACSSSKSSSGEDLDIAEIQEIEATGEFSEDEFFADDGANVGIEEEQLVEDVPGLEAELEGLDEKGAVATDNEVAVEGLDFEVKGESGDVVSDEAILLEGADLFEDDLIAEEPNAASGDVAVEGEDLGFEEQLDFGDDATVAGSEVEGEGALEFDSGEDLFREDTVAVETSPDEAVVSEEQFLSEDTSTPDFAGDSYASNEPKASDMIDEDVSIDVDYSAGSFASDEVPSSQLLSEDVSIDVDYGNGVDEFTSGSSFNTASTKPAASFVPVKKMKTVPYTKNGVLVNAIYFVRPGDTLSSIGNKIYGSGSAVDLRLVNPHLKAGALRVGQKVYYNSPRRSQDQSRILTYYEDSNVPQQIYNASQGENIRTISKNLLGHERSWMEVWASNQQIQSKWGLEAPYSIRYWNGSAAPVPAPAPTMAQVQPASPVAAPLEPALSSPTKTASVNIATSEPEPVFEEEPMMEEEAFAEVEEPVLDEPSMKGEDDIFAEEPMDAGFEEPVAVNEPVAEDPFAADAGFDDMAGGDNVNAGMIDERDIARDQGGAFPSKSNLMSSDNMRMFGIIGAAVLLLLLAFILIRRRRAAAGEPIEMESFDFGGETTIEDAQTKTQIDL